MLPALNLPQGFSLPCTLGDSSPSTSDWQRLVLCRLCSSRKVEGQEKVLQQHLTLLCKARLCQVSSHGGKDTWAHQAPQKFSSQDHWCQLHYGKSPCLMHNICHLWSRLCSSLEVKALLEKQNFGVVLPQGFSGTQKTKESYLHLEKKTEKSAVLCCSIRDNSNQMLFGEQMIATWFCCCYS